MEETDFLASELRQILGSRLFFNKKQASNFLAYISSEMLAGRGEKITQYAIAVEALGKPEDYCPTENPAVRVEAGRVRKLLEEYYATEGRHSKYRIVLPVGSYQPVIEQVSLSSPLAAELFEPKSIQSLGPRVYINCQNPSLIRDDTLRNLLYNMRSVLPRTLGHLREISIALANADHASRHPSDDLEYAWRNHQADFLLQCTAETGRSNFTIRFSLFHTLNRETVWADTLLLPQHHSQQELEAVFGQLILEVFSLHRGVALSYWSRYWKAQETIPSYHQVLVEHVSFIQENPAHGDITLFLQACQIRTQSYHDDALAHLHYAVLCLYAYMFGLDPGSPLETLWHKLALRAVELNPGNALAHSIFALECYHRGDLEMGRVEIETARSINPLDGAGGHLMAVGLCALGHWEQAFNLLRDVSGLNSNHPDPLRTIPCLFYFRRGEFIRLANIPCGLQELGGWETFGKMTNHCRMDDCQGCVQTISQSVDHASQAYAASKQAASGLWASIQHRLTGPRPSARCDDDNGITMPPMPLP